MLVLHDFKRELQSHPINVMNIIEQRTVFEIKSKKEKREYDRSILSSDTRRKFRVFRPCVTVVVNEFYNTL